MTNITIYHNPKCSKSRETLALLTSKGITPNVILYLDNPPSVPTLMTLLEQLKFKSARELMRSKDPLYQQLNLANHELTEQQLLTTLHTFPQLIERPIVVVNNQAKIGRPPESILAMI